MALITWVVLTYVSEFQWDMQPFCIQWPYIFCFQLFYESFLWFYLCCLLQKRRVFLADPNKLSGSSCFVRALSDTQLKRLLSKIALIWVVLTYVREFKRDMQPFCFQWPYIFCFQLFFNFFMKVFCDFTCNGEIGYSDLKHTKHRCIILHLNAWQFCVGPSTNNVSIFSQSAILSCKCAPTPWLAWICCMLTSLTCISKRFPFINLHVYILS